MTTEGPVAVVALPLYNHAHQLREALDSLRHQTRRDFVVLMGDDLSTDETPEICRAVCEADGRFHYLRHETRQGYLGNTQTLLRVAQERWPAARFFAWGSDHDLWHPRWLERLIDALEAEPAAMLAWPRVHRIDDEGNVLRRVVHRFELREADPTARGRRLLAAMARGEATAGNMIYGLFRMEALTPGPNPPGVMLPDRLLLLEAGLKGSVVQVDEALWYRRYEGIASPARQRRALFPNGVPLHARLPPGLVHAIALAARPGSDLLPKGLRLRVAAAFLTDYLPAIVGHRIAMKGPQLRRWLGFRIGKPIHMALHRTRKRIRGRAAGLRKRLRG